MTDHSLNRFLLAPGADADPAETAEWREALSALIASEGPERARFILDQLAAMARTPQVGWSPELVTPYVNTIPVEQQPAFPGDLAIEERLASLMRWNALAMVAKANGAYGELGGQSPATRARPTCSRWASTISSTPGATRTAATWCSSSRTARRASMRARSSRAG